MEENQQGNSIARELPILCRCLQTYQNMVRSCHLIMGHLVKSRTRGLHLDMPNNLRTVEGNILLAMASNLHLSQQMPKDFKMEKSHLMSISQKMKRGNHLTKIQDSTKAPHSILQRQSNAHIAMVRITILPRTLTLVRE